MIDGLKLTMTGLQLKEKLEERIAWHQTQAADSVRLLRAPDQTAECAPPEAVLERAIRQAHSQIETLTLIRDYIIVDELYRLSEFDLRFADLLPEVDWFDCDCLDVDPRRTLEPGLFDAEGQPTTRN